MEPTISSPPSASNRSALPNNTSQFATNTTDTSVSLVKCHLPPFWRLDPIVWFAQVEAEFRSTHVVSSQRKFNKIVACLPPDVAMDIRDIILDPPATTPYEIVKAEIIKRTTLSERKRLQQLLSSEVLGDQSPSQLLRKLVQLLGGTPIDDSLLKEIFLSRLPADIQKVLVSSRNTSLTDLASMADQVMEISSPISIAAINNYSKPVSCSCNSKLLTLESSLQTINSKLASLTQELSRFTTSSNDNFRDRRRSRSNSRSLRGDDPENKKCWFHYNFGTKARKCVAPCISGNAPLQD